MHELGITFISFVLMRILETGPEKHIILHWNLISTNCSLSFICFPLSFYGDLLSEFSQQRDNFAMFQFKDSISSNIVLTLPSSPRLLRKSVLKTLDYFRDEFLDRTEALISIAIKIVITKEATDYVYFFWVVFVFRHWVSFYSLGWHELTSSLQSHNPLSEKINLSLQAWLSHTLNKIFLGY